MQHAIATGARVAMLAGTMALAGCAAIPHDAPSQRALSAQAVGLSDGPPAFVDAAWWRSLGDPQLDGLMDEALQGNPGLEVAMARLRAAEAAVGIEHAGLEPRLDVDIQENRERLSGRYIIPPPYAGTSRWVGTAQANLSWSLDLAGRQKALVSEARHDAGGAALDVAAARITLTGAIAQAYVNLARAYRQADLAERFVQSRQAQLDLAQTRRTTRIASDFDLRAAETLLAEARKALVRAEGDKALMVHALAALSGRGAVAYAGIGAPVGTLGEGLAVPASLPADLLGRRPDILAAQQRILAAGDQRRAARADFYPDVDLRAFAGLSAIGAGALFTGNASTYGVGPALHLPIFEGGRLTARYRQTLAGQDAAIAQYNELVVGAVREVADALSTIDTNAQSIVQQEAVSRGLSDTVTLDDRRIRSGLASRLDLLDAQDRVLAAEQTLVDLRADGTLARIRLLVAAGGGFPTHHDDGTALAEPMTKGGMNGKSDSR
jgi:NodT family efflux transporter outer membrane factor (OMF) lipoprotein